VVLGEGMPPMATRRGALFPPPPAIEPDPAALRIAVPAMVAKLNAHFLTVCRSILAKSDRRIEFHFFPDTVGLDAYLTSRELGRWVRGAVLHPRLDYSDYLEALARCDLHLSPFPFGGTNSNIDSMRLGIPMIACEGPELHAQTDAAMMRHAGLPETLIARDAREYERIALRVIADDRERAALAAQLRQTDIPARFLERSDHRFAEEVLRLFRWIHAEHEAIQASGRRYWTVVDRRGSFPAYAP
jgi:hypothetical protein